MNFPLLDFGFIVLWLALCAYVFWLDVKDKRHLDP
jgi:hypothetical protein